MAAAEHVTLSKHDVMIHETLDETLVFNKTYFYILNINSKVHKWLITSNQF